MPENSNIVLEAILHRRSIRSFSSQPIPREIILSLIQAGNFAPSGLNLQPFRFFVTTPDMPETAKLAECTKYAKMLRSAQALISVFLDTSKMYHQLKDHQSAGACIQNILLAAHSHGLGAVWVGEILNQSEQVYHALNITHEQYEFIATVALGYPTVANPEGQRPELRDIILNKDFLKN